MDKTNDIVQRAIECGITEYFGRKTNRLIKKFDATLLHRNDHKLIGFSDLKMLFFAYLVGMLASTTVFLIEILICLIKQSEKFTINLMDILAYFSYKK